MYKRETYRGIVGNVEEKGVVNQVGLTGLTNLQRVCVQCVSHAGMCVRE